MCLIQKIVKLYHSLPWIRLSAWSLGGRCWRSAMAVLGGLWPFLIRSLMKISIELWHPVMPEVSLLNSNIAEDCSTLHQIDHRQQLYAAKINCSNYKNGQTIKDSSYERPIAYSWGQFAYEQLHHWLTQMSVAIVKHPNRKCSRENILNLRHMR